MTRSNPRKTCTYHCSTCGSHFHSLGAFDAHTPGKKCDLKRKDKHGETRLVAWTDEGYCRLADGTTDYIGPVTIYTLRGWDDVGEKLR